ncbi:MAG: hypothetical protein FWD11_07325 [Micrococcales bacterium]|nr:hypothetical protein [Micrococcales bacterium]
MEWYNVENDTTGGNSGDELIPDISDFKVVPGSMIRADVTVSVDLPNSVWDGDELLAEVTSIAADGDAQPSADSPLVVVDVDTTQASLGLISITFEFPLAETDYAGQSTGKSDVDLGGLVVTLTQVRAGHADA